jgi:phage/plasmid-associated DNA primase
MAILGPYAAQADSEMFCQQFRPQSGGHSEDIANLCGKRLVVGTELPENRRMAVPKIKQMTGGARV